MTHSALSTAPALILTGLLAGLLAAAVPAAAAEPAATPAAPALEGTSWLLAAFRDGTGLVDSAATPRPARFRFEAGKVAGSAGCNLIGGAYTLTGTGLSFKANLTSTMMACPPPLMKQEKAVGLALTRVTSYRLDGEVLELLDTAGAPLLRFRWQKPAPLVGQAWQLTGYNNGKHAISSVRAGTEVTLEFRDDGTLGGSDGCNRYMSGYTLAGESLTIGPLASTRMACKGPEGAMEQARDYAAALGTVTGYRIESGELTLLTADGKPAARYRAEAPAPIARPPEEPANAADLNTPTASPAPVPVLAPAPTPAPSPAPAAGAGAAAGH